jgi:hypothetical protein
MQRRQFRFPFRSSFFTLKEKASAKPPRIKETGGKKMEKYVARMVLLLFFMFGFVAVSMAEPRGDFEGPPTKEQMEKVRSRIETLRMWKLTKTLDLDEKTSAQLFPLLNRYDKKRAEIENALRDTIRELRESLRGKREGQLKSLLDRLEQNHKSMQGIKDAEWEELKGILSLEQQAKFIIFQLEFEREIKKIIEETRERRQDRLGKDMPARPMSPQRP